MLAGEFMTAVEHRLPLKIVVYDNSGWGLVRIEMEGAGMPAMAGAAFPNMNFAALAEACGAKGCAAEDPAGLEPAVHAFLEAEGPAMAAMPSPRRSSSGRAAGTQPRVLRFRRGSEQERER
jgi:pyruvate dehydrogenase (quinone)